VANLREAGITLAYGAMAGADIFGHFGICGADLGGSLIMLMMQHEIIGYIERIMQGIKLDDETLGIDVIRRVGQGGNFIAEEHTVKHFRKELWFPELLDRDFWDIWTGKGRKDMMTRCRELKENVLREHNPVPLDEGTLKKVDKLIEDAKRHLLK